MGKSGPVTNEALEQMLRAAEGDPPRRLPTRFDPDIDALYGGVAGCSLAVPEYQLAPGLVARRTFAHVMAPYLVAFAPPDAPGKPHPGPWRAVLGGLAFDISFELALSAEASPTTFDRLNTVWWALALLRLVSGASIRMPVLSSVPFQEAIGSGGEPVFQPMELERPRLHAVAAPPATITEADLAWARGVFVSGGKLMDTPHLNRAMQTFDGALWAHSRGSAIVMVWAAMETLFRPGQRNIAKSLSTSMATFIEPPGRQRERLQQRIAFLYEARGNSIHDSQVPEREALLESIAVGRRALMSCLETNLVPNIDELRAKWAAELNVNRA